MKLLLTTATALLLLAGTGDANEKSVRLFILSGQSNMAALDPAVSFTPAVTAAFAADEVIVVKEAWSGNPIMRWYKKWKSPGDEQGRNIGRNYDMMMKAVTAAIDGKPRAKTVVFVWMQGEADTKLERGKAYAESLNGLLQQLEDDLDRKDIFFVLGRMSDFGNKLEDRPDWNLVREAQVKFAEAGPRRAWVDTDDLNGKHNGLHYNKPGYAELGKRFADKSIELIKNRE